MSSRRSRNRRRIQAAQDPGRAEHPADRLGHGAEPRSALRLDRRADGRDQEEIQEVEGIGPDRAEAIAEWFSDDENRKLIEELRGLGLSFEAGDELKPVEGPLAGQTYVLTGTLESFTRDEAAAALEAKGAKVGNSVSKKTAGVIVGESAGLEAAEGPAGRRADPRRAGAEVSTGQLGRPRSGPGPCAPRTSRPASRSG